MAYTQKHMQGALSKKAYEEYTIFKTAYEKYTGATLSKKAYEEYTVITSELRKHGLLTPANIKIVMNYVAANQHSLPYVRMEKMFLNREPLNTKPNSIDYPTTHPHSQSIYSVIPTLPVPVLFTHSTTASGSTSKTADEPVNAMTSTTTSSTSKTATDKPPQATGSATTSSTSKTADEPMKVSSSTNSTSSPLMYYMYTGPRGTGKTTPLHSYSVPDKGYITLSETVENKEVVRIPCGPSISMKCSSTTAKK